MKIEKEYILHLTDDEMSIIITALHGAKATDPSDNFIIADMLHAIENMPRS